MELDRPASPSSTPEPPPQRPRRPAWQVALVSAAAVLVVFTAVPAAFGLVHLGRATPHRPIGVPAASTVTTIPAVGPAIAFPDSLGGLLRNAAAPLPQVLGSDGLAMGGAWY